jgi:hypothetical protein
MAGNSIPNSLTYYYVSDRTMMFRCARKVPTSHEKARISSDHLAIGLCGNVSGHSFASA